MEAYQVGWGRISSCADKIGNVMALRKNITWKKGKEKQYIIFPIILRLLGRISSGEERKKCPG